MFIISKVKMLIIAIVRILSQWDKVISSPPYTVNTTLYMKHKVKYKNFDRILTVALLGDYSQNVPKSNCTFVETKFTQVRSKLTQVVSKRTQCVAKMNP